jgi:CBS domain-containing protein
MNSILVNDVYQLHGTASISISKEELLSDVISRFAYEPGLRGIFLVDSENRFSSIITRIAIMKWAQYKLTGNIKKEISARSISDAVASTKASNLARGDYRTLGVRENDTLQSALDQMVDFEEDVLPVLDQDGRILGDIRLSEVLLKTFEVGRTITG